MSAPPTPAAAPSTTSSPPISSCAKRARWCRSNRCGSCAPAAIRRPMRRRSIQTRRGRAPGGRQGRRAAVRDFPRRVSRRQRRRHRPRPRGAAPVRRSRPDAARSRRRHEAARLAVRDPADARSRRGAARHRELRRPQGTVRAAQRLRAQLHRRHAGAHRRRPQPGGAVGDQRAGRPPRRPGRSAQDARRRDRRRRPCRIAGAARSTCRRSIRSSDRRTVATSSIYPSTRATAPTTRRATALRRLAEETDGAAIRADAGLRPAARGRRLERATTC